jgi:hypothetical protein
MKFTVLKHEGTGNAPGKSYALAPDGKLVKTTYGSRTRFKAEVVELDIADLDIYLGMLGADCHITSGISEHTDARAVTQGVFSSAYREGRMQDEDGLPFITFTDDDLRHRPGIGGLLVIDSDGAQDASVFDQLVAAVPALADYSRVEASSSSSFIRRADDGTELNGLKGMHTFFEVRDQEDIPRAIKVLFKRVTLAGFLRPMISETGAFLERNCVDRQLRVPSQPVFIAAIMGEGLKQEKIIKFFPAKEAVLDTRAVIADLTPAEEAAYMALVADARLKLLGASHAARDKYIEDRAAEIVKDSNGSTTLAQAKTSLLKALSGSVLGPKHPVTLSDGRVVLAKDIAASPDVFHRASCRDPLEVSYGSKSVAMIFADGLTPVVYSHAHGGRLFRFVAEFPPLTGTEFAEEVARLDKAELAEIEAMRGDPELALWLDADVMTGKALVWTKAGDAEADTVALNILKGELGITGGSPPASVWDVVPGTALDLPGLRFRKHTSSRPVVVRLSSAGSEKLLREWAAGDKDAALRRWASVLGEHAAIDGEADPVFAATARMAAKVLGLTPADASERLLDGVLAHGLQLSNLTAKAKPQPPLDASAGPSPEELAAAGLREALVAETAELLLCRHIAENPLGALDKAFARAGLAGERENALFCYLVTTSAHLAKPANGLLRGPAGSGKSFVMKATTALFPAEFVYLASSVSARSLVYEPQGFEHRTIILEEAEALVRANAEDKNEVAEMLRLLLSEGQLTHKSVVRNPQTGQFETQTYSVTGPTNLLTSTTRPNLDPEIATRLIDRWSDTTSGHVKQVMEALGKKATGDFADGPERDAWHAFARWVRFGPHVVVVPFAPVVAATFSTSGGSRAFRDFNNVMSLVQASALIHRLHRKVDAEGRLVATVEDYALAHRILGERIDELSGERVPDVVKDKFTLLRAAIDAKKTFNHGGVGWEAGHREIATVLQCSKSVVGKELHRMENNGLIRVVRPQNPNLKTVLMVADDADAILQGGAAMMTPEELKKALAKVEQGDVKNGEPGTAQVDPI